MYEASVSGRSTWQACFSDMPGSGGSPSNSRWGWPCWASWPVSWWPSAPSSACKRWQRADGVFDVTTLAHLSGPRLIRYARVAALLRARLLLLLLLLLMLLFFALPAASAASAPLPETRAVCQPWPRWEAFKTRFISAQGRVIDIGSSDTRPTSEGQSYGLFFALVANDKPAFEKLLIWTQSNLAQDDLIGHLPAWLWG